MSNIGSTSVSNANVDSGFVAFGSCEVYIGDNGSVTAASDIAQQHSGSIAVASLDIKKKSYYATAIGEGSKRSMR